MAKPKSNNEKLFDTYIRDKKIVVADASNASRAGLARAMSNMGAQTQFMTLANTYEVARDAIAKHKPNIVICDFEIGGGRGLDLLQQQRKENPDSKNSLFVLVTGNSSQSAVAQAAEEDVDTFLLKPYTIEVLRQSIMKAVLAKIQPSEYMKTINEGKAKLFEEGKPEDAIALFKKARTLDKKPALAFFYLGQAEEIKKALDLAEGDYQQGLSYNKIHYKCMVGLFEMLMGQKKYAKAYDVVKKISRYFPANPQRLASVLRLAIMTGAYEDIERYYQAFTGIDQRDEMLVKYVCAALVVCGKYYLKNSHNARALELFEKAGITAGGRTKILREIITTLLQAELPAEAEKYLKRFPSANQSEADFLVCEFMVHSAISPPAMSVDRGRKILAQGISDPDLYKGLAKVYLQTNLKDAASSLLDKGKELWPNLAKDFEALLPEKK